MTKEELIKEAWGKLMPDYTNIDLNIGWSLDDFYEYSYNENEFHTQQIYEPCKIRPKSLQGIEDNNRWIKIESEEDLPKENGMYHVYYSDDTVSSRFYHIKYNDWRNEPKATHYQPIEKPKPPLY